MFSLMLTMKRRHREPFETPVPCEDDAEGYVTWRTHLQAQGTTAVRRLARGASMGGVDHEDWVERLALWFTLIGKPQVERYRYEKMPAKVFHDIYYRYIPKFRRVQCTREEEVCVLRANQLLPAPRPKPSKQQKPLFRSSWWRTVKAHTVVYMKRHSGPRSSGASGSKDELEAIEEVEKRFQDIANMYLFRPASEGGKAPQVGHACYRCIPMS